jgi:DNA-binding GntR family transcriptional regulator
VQTNEQASMSYDAVLTKEQLSLGERTSATYDVLREWIISGELAPGAEVSQLELTRRLGVSRTPLREALRLLTRDGLVVETEAHRLVQISALSMADLDEVYALRIPAAAIAVWQTVPKLTVSDLMKMRADIELISDENIIIARDAHRRLHASLAKYAGPRIQDALWGFMVHSERYQRAFTNQTRLGRKRKDGEHRAIVKACEQADCKTACELLIHHMASTAISLMEKHNYRPVVLPAAVSIALGAHLG